MFNLFRAACEPTIFCAIRDGAALPPFLRAPAWSYEGRAIAPYGTTADLDRKAEAALFRQTGFYIFARD